MLQRKKKTLIYLIFLLQVTLYLIAPLLYLKKSDLTGGYSMKVVVAIDSLKGSLTSMEAGNAIKEGILKAGDAQVIVKPLADGGEGTTDALIEGLNGERREVSVMGPLGETVHTYYGYLKESNTAVIEMAAAAGIILVKDQDKDPMKATTYGVGQMIKDAIDLGCRDFIIGIGGSATNDGGVGMLQALGYEFLDANGQDVGFGGGALAKISEIRCENRLKELDHLTIKVACDVTNPLCGENGATYIYGPQKGVTDEMKPVLDQDMASYAKVVMDKNGVDLQDSPGAGAAGGMGFAFLSFLKANLVSGIDLILDAVALEKSMEGADVVITGEGRLDHQTAMGKAPVGVAKMAKKQGIKVIALAGSLTPGAKACNEAGIDAYFSILTSVISLEEAMKKDVASKNLTDTTEQIFRLIQA